MDAEPVVFIVDDDPSVLKALTRLLSGEGFHIRPFASPAEFLRNHDPQVPGCIILDFAMPGFNGLQLQKHLGRIAERQPIIFVSGQSDIPISVSAMKGGASDFLTKPVDAASLIWPCGPPCAAAKPRGNDIARASCWSSATRP